jgi:hypothetical protein
MEKNRNINILIGTPAYGGMMHMDFVNSLLDYHKAGIPFTLAAIGNESLITRGRNTIISLFNDHKEFTHLLFLDADIGLKSEDLIRLLSHDKDVIGAPVALKGFDDEGNPVLNTGEHLEQEGGLTVVDRVGTAVFILSRVANDVLINSSDIYPPRGESFSLGVKLKNPQYDVFQVGVKDGEYLSEDYWVCKTLQEKGFKVYVDTSIPVRHNGNYCFHN